LTPLRPGPRGSGRRLLEKYETSKDLTWIDKKSDSLPTSSPSGRQMPSTHI
jgi:hypothetical protein